MTREVRFKIVSAKKASKKYLAASLDIYIRSIDSNGITSTNEISYYIDNPKIDAKREMFFYVLYYDGEVCGFAEAGFLHEIDAIIIDYLCTNPRNQTLFFNFYNLMISAIEKAVNKTSVYKITELTTTKNKDNKLCDVDSNYFRKMLSFENFKIIKAPYYVPPDLCPQKKEEALEYNLAVCGNFTSLSRNTFLHIVKCLYYDHYLTWYAKFDDEVEAKEYLDKLFQKIISEMPKKEDTIYDAEFLLVNCKIYEEGKCTHVNIQNLTRKRRREKVFGKFILLVSIAIGAITVGLLTIFYRDHILFAALAAGITAGLTIMEIIKKVKSK